MYGYVKTTRLVLIEYLSVLLLHTIYGFVHYGTQKGQLVLMVSAIMFSLTMLIALFVKKESVVVLSLFVSILISTSIIGYILDTLAFSVLVSAITCGCISIYMEAKYIIYSAALSLITFILYLVFIPDKIVKNVPILMFVIYIGCFVICCLNLYVVVVAARKYMKGMEDKATEAQRANESKMLFLANMSHDIRTPMNAICGMAELTQRKEGLPDDVKDNLETIQTSGRVLISIINDILDYSKLESGNMEIIPVTYSLRHQIDDVMNMMTVKLEDKSVDLKANIDPTIPDILIGDEIRIRQILFNLLSNAVKYTDSGYIILDATGNVEGGFVDLTIKVTDSGIGIKKDDMDKLFTSFQTFDTRKSSSREGTGLGLAICKELLAHMGGDIEAESTYGVGSKFTVHISQKVSDEDIQFSDNSESNELENSHITATDAKVLVVDDNAVNLKVAEGLLKTFGIYVDTCKSGRECLEILKTTKDYDIIFIDHMMPELDGIDTLNLIRADSNTYMQKVPLIALTANVVSGARDMFISEGFNDYVPKPIDMVWLNGILRKYLPLEKQH